MFFNTLKFFILVVYKKQIASIFSLFAVFKIKL